jgi:hypothetical protein
VCSELLCHVCGVISLDFMALFMVLFCGLVQVLFLSLVIKFLVFNCHFPVAALGLDPFSGTYLNELLFLWCPVFESGSV